jgi:hydroxymethylglutaryl-CoA lyase
MQRIHRQPTTLYTALVPNLRGAERALATGIDEFNLVMSVSETHNLCNLRMTREQSFFQLSSIIAAAKAVAIPVNISLSCVFGCPMEGEISPEGVSDWVERFACLGVRGITLCDTTGMAFPLQVSALCQALTARFNGLDFTAHFHNTRAMGMVNCLAAAQSNIRRFDMSLGGIGGCRYAPGASGNVATEDVVHMFECMGYNTGLDFEGLISSAAVLAELVKHVLPGQLARAGHRLTKHAPPAGFSEIVARAHDK